MKRVMVLLLLCGACSTRGTAQMAIPNDLPALIADPRHRREAVEAVVTRRRELVPLLLGWFTRPPVGVDPVRFREGLILTISEAKVSEAAPLLAENITWRPLPIPVGPVWDKPPSTIISAFPCIKALLLIGPQSVPSLLSAHARSTDPEVRLAAVFTLSQLRSPEAEAALKEILDYALTTARFAESGLRRVGKPRAP